MVEVRRKSYLKLDGRLGGGDHLPLEEFFEGINETRNATARILDSSETKAELRIRFEAEQAEKRNEKPEKEPGSTIFDFKGDMYQMYPFDCEIPTKQYPYSVEYMQVRSDQEINRRIISVKLASQKILKA